MVQITVTQVCVGRRAYFKCAVNQDPELICINDIALADHLTCVIGLNEDLVNDLLHKLMYEGAMKLTISLDVAA